MSLIHFISTPHLMANPEHLAILEQGSNAWRTWREAHPTIKPDLRAADLRPTSQPHSTIRHRFSLASADLRGADLRDARCDGLYFLSANFQGANLRGATLRGVHFYRTNLRGANLTGANLRAALLRENDLRGACLLRANLSHAQLYRADLRGADLREAIFKNTGFAKTRFEGSVMEGTALVDLDLRSVRGLAEVVHRGPSSLGINTLLRSREHLPLAFLQGCGVPESVFASLPASNDPTRDCVTCCIVYADTDATFAHRLASALQGRGVRCWLQEHSSNPYSSPSDLPDSSKERGEVEERKSLEEDVSDASEALSENSVWQDNDPEDEYGDFYERTERERHPWDKVILCGSRAALSSAWIETVLEKALAHEHALAHDFAMAHDGRKFQRRVLLPLSLDGYLRRGWRRLGDEVEDEESATDSQSEAANKTQAKQPARSPKSRDAHLIKAVRRRLVADCWGWQKDDSVMAQTVDALLPVLRRDAQWEGSDNFRLITWYRDR